MNGSSRNLESDLEPSGTFVLSVEEPEKNSFRRPHGDAVGVRSEGLMYPAASVARGFAQCVAVSCLAACAGRTETRSPAQQPIQSPLPESVEICAAKAIALPAKIDGRPWDGFGNRVDVSSLSKIASLAATGGYAAVIAGAGEAARLFSNAKDKPELQLIVEVGRKRLLETGWTKDALIGTYGETDRTCGRVDVESYSKSVRVRVIDRDLENHDAVGQKVFSGIPEAAIRAGIWRINGFDAVVEVELTIQSANPSSS